MNDCKFYGRLTADPELRYTPNGVAVATFTLAVDQDFTNQQGERGTDFVNFVIWRKAAEAVANNFQKGKPMLVKKSRFRLRKHEKEDGTKNYYPEFIVEEFGFSLSDPTYQGGGQQQPRQQRQQQQQRQPGHNQNIGSPYDYQDNKGPFQNDGTPIDISDDDLPF